MKKKVLKKSKSKKAAVKTTRKTTRRKQTALARTEPATIQVSDPIVNEIAGGISSDLETFQYLVNTHDPNPIWKNPKFTGLHLFQEMDTDSRVSNVMAISKDGIAMRTSRVRPGDKSEDQAIKAAWCIYNLKQIPDLTQGKKDIMSCLDFGYSFTEIKIERRTVTLEYEFDGQQKSIELQDAVVVVDLLSRPVTAFFFDKMNRAYFTGNQKDFGSFFFTDSGKAKLLTPAEEEKFIIATHDPRFKSRYGWSVKVSMFPPYLSKKAVKLWRLIHVNRLAMPIPHGKYKQGAKKEGPGGTDEFKKRLAGLQNAAYVMTPVDFTVEFLRAMESGDMDPYQNLLDYADYEIAEAGLGHREATSQAGTGSYASEVLKSTALRQEKLVSRCVMLDTTLRFQLLKRMCDWNFVPTGLYPKHETDSSAMKDKSQIISQYETGHSMGIDLDLEQVREDMEWRKPGSDETTLKGNTSHVFPDRTDRQPNPSEQP